MASLHGNKQVMVACYPQEKPVRGVREGGNGGNMPIKNNINAQ